MLKNSADQGLPAERDFVRDLLELCRFHRIPLDSQQAVLCYQHIQAMLRWNLRCNLTRITEPQEILGKHLLDALLPARWLPCRGRALDIGTGAGFPGIPLKILNPGLRMVLLEANHKKVSFLKVVLAQLHLENLTALQGRWEDLAAIASPLVHEPYGLITLRALKLPGPPFGSFAARTLQPGGILAYWGGPHSGAEEFVSGRESIGDQLVFAGCQKYQLPGNYGQRQLLLWRRDP